MYSMAPDATPLPPSNAPTPVFSPLPSGVNTPHSNDSKLDYLAAPLAHQGSTGYLAGCRALDSLARMIASTESFFHPSNSGSWTADVCIDSRVQRMLSETDCNLSVERFSQIYCL